MTNYERIIHMSIEEIANMIHKISTRCYFDECENCPFLEYDNCSIEAKKQWLESEVTE